MYVQLWWFYFTYTPSVPKLIVLFFGIFCPKNIVVLSAQLEIEVKIIFSHQAFYIKKSFDTATSGDILE